MKPVKVPKHIDAPMQMAFWEIDEVAPMVMLMALGILTGTLTYMFLLMYGGGLSSMYCGNEQYPTPKRMSTKSETHHLLM